MTTPSGNATRNNDDDSTSKALDVRWFRRHLDDYLSESYLGLHNVIVGVALGIAGLAVMSLSRSPLNLSGYGLVLKVLLLPSFLATLVAYAGAAIGAAVLPPRMPAAIHDLAPPLLIAVAEFAMFAVLIHDDSSHRPDIQVVQLWLLSYVLFAGSASWSVFRVRYVYGSVTYLGVLKDEIDLYRQRLAWDGGAACSGAAVAAVALAASLVAPGKTLDWTYASLGLIVTGEVAGLASHAVNSRRFQQLSA